MIYRVVLDGVDILDYSSKDLSLISPVLELEVNNAGSLEFVMPPNHTYYDSVNMLASTIEVYEDDTLIWFGRPVDETIDFYKQKKIYCEGPFSFFNDTVQRPQEYESISIYSFFESIIDTHNSQLTNRDRKFKVGQITVNETYGYRKLNYETSHDAIQNMCLDTNDGYLFFRREDGVNYIDWFAEMPFACNQSIEFGVNLLNYRSTFSGGDYATCVLPLGKQQKDTGEPLNIRSVNNGSDILQSVAATTYGNIIKVQQYSDIDDALNLLEEGRKYLENSQFNSLVIECSAADLHSLLPEKQHFQIGQTIHCVSEPHLIDRDFPISKMTINLDSAAKTITLGLMKKKTLTRIYKEDTEASESHDDGGGYIDGIIEDPTGGLWEIVPPEEEGGEVTAKKAPTHIEVSKPPNKTNYRLGDTIDYSGISVNIWCEDHIWTNPPRYLDGKAPFSELSFPTKKVSTTYDDSGNTGNSFHISVPVVWYYKGQKYETVTTLNVVAIPTTEVPTGISSEIRIGDITVPYQFGGGLYYEVLDSSGAISRTSTFYISAYAVAFILYKDTPNERLVIQLFSRNRDDLKVTEKYHIYHSDGTLDVDKIRTMHPNTTTTTIPIYTVVDHQPMHGKILYAKGIYGSTVSNMSRINVNSYMGPPIIEQSFTDAWLNEVMYQILYGNGNFIQGGR